MLFPTVQFAVFFVAVFMANWLLRPLHWAWRLAMIGASFTFYFQTSDSTSLDSWTDGKPLEVLGRVLPADGSAFVLLLALSVVANWLFGQAIHLSLRDGAATAASRLWVRIAVGANLGVLAYFKYSEFFVNDVANAVPFVDLDPEVLGDVILPVGISFFTFQALSYVIDIGRLKIRPMGFGDFALYLSFFPQLVAGPIVRATEFAPQLRRRPDPRRIESAEAFRLIGMGLFKKVVVSSYLAAEIVDPVFAVPGEHSSLEVLLAVYGYAIQIYADFSGYTDIAIGCALLLGFRFPPNFDAPYRSLSIQEFWRRWHMTLSRWLRDYLYIPLGGNRKGPNRTYSNLMLTMVLGGLWHGAAWTFVIWGAIHGGWLIGERVVGERWTPIGLPGPVVRVLKWFVTFHVVCLAWIFFRAQSLDLALETLGQLVGGLGDPTTVVTGTALVLLVAVIVVSLASQFVPDSAVLRAQDRFSRLGLAWQGITLGAALLVIDTLGPEGVAPFIYFQF